MGSKTNRSVSSAQHEIAAAVKSGEFDEVALESLKDTSITIGDMARDDMDKAAGGKGEQALTSPGFYDIFDTCKKEEELAVCISETVVRTIEETRRTEGGLAMMGAYLGLTDAEIK